LSDGRKKKYIEMFGSFTEPFSCFTEGYFAVIIRFCNFGWAVQHRFWNVGELLLSILIVYIIPQQQLRRQSGSPL